MTYTYISHAPVAPLDRYIDDLYYWHGPAPFAKMKVPPMPAMHLMVNLGDPFRIFRPGQSAPIAICSTSWAVGLWRTYHEVEWPRNVVFYGVHFKPGGAYPLRSCHNHC
ncbi:MAG: hypothetical protein HC853_10550 [Anaerolineae bacterium]|nr:hypothetical protein [Anaerolineae bacterium]